MPRDLNIIKAVNDYQAMNIAQIETRFFNTPKPAYGRLKKLFDYGYLERHYITQVAKAPAASPIVYTISKLGAEILATNFGYDTNDFNFVTTQISNWKTLQHILAIGDFRAVFERACEGATDMASQWTNEAYFRANPDYVNVSQAKTKNKRKPVFPDGYVILKTPEGTARFFVEVDRGTEPLSQFSSQIEIYQEYIRSGLYQERFKSTSLRILVITTTERRMISLMRATAQVANSDRYWFTHKEIVSKQTVLTHPIWSKITSDEHYSLVE
jgi:hypothetical protein